MSIGLAGWVNALWPANVKLELLLFVFGSVLVDDEDKLLLFNKFEFDPWADAIVVFNVLALWCGPTFGLALPNTPNRPLWWDIMLGADVFRPSDVVGMAGLTKRSLVRRAWRKNIGMRLTKMEMLMSDAYRELSAHVATTRGCETAWTQWPATRRTMWYRTANRAVSVIGQSEIFIVETFFVHF